MTELPAGTEGSSAGRPLGSGGVEAWNTSGEDPARAGYLAFLTAKARRAGSCGHRVDDGAIHPSLFAWQREIVRWAVRQGRAALFADTGLGKTRMQVEWARLSADSALILAPLTVCHQTVREAAKLGATVRYVRGQHEVAGPGLWITNYEMAEHMDATSFGAVVLDESSILKNVDGKTRRRLTEQLAVVPRRLACTATPAPNDVAELTNHAEWLGVSTRSEMLSAYFVNDEKAWRLKGHAAGAMYRWMASWAVALRRPSDLGYPDDGYDLPPLTITPHLLPVEVDAPDQLFATDLGGVGGRAKVRKETLGARVEHAAKLVTEEPDEPWIVWCGLNAEADAITAMVPGAVNVEGTWTPEAKADALARFVDGDIPVLVTKPSIAGFGMNFQHCARMVFLGLSDSYEAYYQAIRRCYRYGQSREVVAHIVLSELEGQIAANVARKEREASRSTAALVEAVRAAWKEAA